LLKGSAEFFLDYMVTDPSSGYLMTGPSTSPENSFRYKKDILSLSMMPTCDRVLVAELFNACISATAVTGDDTEFRDKLISASEKLPPFRISRKGEIQEWFNDYEIAQPNHRHTSHLTAIYPFAQITPVRTPDLAKAAEKTISNRLQSPGWEDVEWSRANMINFYARLREPERALQSVNILLKNLTRENLLTISVAGIAGAQRDIFILDGNEAAAAGIAEMLIQSHEDYIEFLPALPKAWDCGQYNGLCVRGGGVASVKWERMKPVEASLVAKTRNHFRIKLPEQMKVSVTINDKQVANPVKLNNILEADMNAGDKLGLKYY
jgi:alpha-L-fucosidase 2